MAAGSRERSFWVVVVAVGAAAACGACSGGGNAADAGALSGSGGQAGGGGAAGAGVCMTTSGGGGSTTDPTVGCAGWRVATSPGRTATAVVGDGSLTFRRPWAPAASPGEPNLFNGADLAIRQSSLCGDFDVTVVWRDFQSGGALGPRLQAGIWWQSLESGMLFQAFAEVVAAGYGDVTIVADGDVTGASVTLMPIDGTSGSFRIARTARTAGHVEVTTKSGDSTVTLASTNAFPDQPYTLFLALGHGPISSDTDNKTGVATVQVDSVTVTGGGGTVVSDDFSCAN